MVRTQVRTFFSYLPFLGAFAHAATGLAQEPEPQAPAVPMVPAPPPVPDQPPPAPAPPPALDQPPTTPVLPVSPLAAEEPSSKPTWRIRDARLVLSAESVTSVWIWSSKSSEDDERSSSLLFQVFSLSELGADFLFRTAPVLTLGGQALVGGSRDLDSDASGRSFWLQPRVGLLLGEGEPFAFWPRAGVGYSSSSRTYSSSGTVQTSSSHGINFLLNPTIIVSPLPGAALTYGLQLETDHDTHRSYSGSRSTSRTFHVELQAGFSLLL